MRPLLTAATCLLMLGLCAFLSGSGEEGTVTLRLRLVDAETGKTVGGMVRLRDAAGGQPIKPAGLLDRM